MVPGSAEAAQPEAVAHHEHRREGHRGAGEHRVEQSGDRQRDGRDVVGERPEQVALDRPERPAGDPDRVRRDPQVTTDQTDVDDAFALGSVTTWS